MIVLKITMNVIPTKQLELLQTLLSMIEPTAKKAGCLSFDVFCDIGDQNRFRMLGEWKTRKALNHHLASHQFGALLGTKALLCEALEIQIYTVSHSEGVAAVQKIRSNKGSGLSTIDEHGDWAV